MNSAHLMNATTLRPKKFNQYLQTGLIYPAFDI